MFRFIVATVVAVCELIVRLIPVGVGVLYYEKIIDLRTTAIILAVVLIEALLANAASSARIAFNTRPNRFHRRKYIQPRYATSMRRHSTPHTAYARSRTGD